MSTLTFNEKNILDQLPNPVFVKNALGNFVYVNQHFLSFFKVSLDTVMGNRTLENVPLFENCKLHEMELTGSNPYICQPFCFEYDMDTNWYQVSVSNFGMGKGQQGRLGIITDVSDRFKVQQELEIKRKFEAAINHISQAVLALVDENEIIAAFVDGTFKEFDLDDCVVYLKSNHDDNYLTKAYALSKNTGANETLITGFNVNQGVVGRAARTRVTQLVNDTTKDPDYFSENIYGLSELAVPIVHQGKLVGVLDSEHSQKNFFSGSLQQNFETCASLLGVKVTQARARKELKEQKSFLDQVLESPKDMHFYAVDENFCYTYFNTKHQENMKSIWGTDVQLGSCILDHITSEKDRKLAKEHLTRALSGDGFTLVQNYGGDNDQLRFWEDIFSPHYHTKGHIEGVSVFTRDITTIIKDREKLKENEQLLLSIHENIPSGLFRTTIEDPINYTNSSMLHLFGYSTEELEEMKLCQLFENKDVHDALVNTLREKHSVQGYEAILRKKSGETFIGLMNVTLWTTHDGVHKIDGAIADLSELHHTKTVLEENNAKLEKINEELDHIVYRTSHDLRSPVASMLGLMQLIERPKDAQGKQYLSMLNDQILRLDGIIQDIVNYRKVATVGIDPKPIQIEEIVQQVFQDLAYLNNCPDINKTIEINNPLSIPVISDPFNLEIIINNLLSNAVKYSDLSKAERYINVTIDVEEELTCLTIEDNGIGISEEYHLKVFDMFFRATHSKNGTGLGLFILKEALRKLSGTVSLESQQGVGTTFKVEIPHIAVSALPDVLVQQKDSKVHVVK